MASSITHTGVGQVSNTKGLGYAFSFATLNREDIQVEVIDHSNNISNKAVYTSGSGHYTIENYLEAGSSNAHIKFVSETARGFTNSQTTYKVRIKRQTPTVPKVNFTAGSSITALDLNTQGKQAFHLSEENRDSINSLAAGDATGAIQISGSNIANNSITTDKILDLEVKSADISSSSSNDSLRAITTDHIRDGAVTDAKLTTVSGSKVTPDFGSQNIVTTGFIGSNDITITGPAPTVNLTDSGDNPDYSIKNLDGTLAITDNTNSAIKFQVNSSDGHVDLPSHVDIGAGADVTGNLTVSGNSTVTGDAIFNNGISSDGKDVYTGNGAFISHDDEGVFSNRTGDNIDHIWHNDSDNSWNFVSDDPYKATGNSKIRAGSFYGDGANLTNLDTAARQFKEATSNGESSKSSTSYSNKVQLSLTGLSSNSRVFLYYNFDYKVTGGSNNKQCYVKIDGPSFLGGDEEFVTTSPSWSTVHGLLFCVSSSSSRNYEIEYRRGNGSSAHIRNARLYALEVRP